jgi:UDP-3-O-[3-hydroxymyristoyl] glucosamine N-acyltransferase
MQKKQNGFTLSYLAKVTESSLHGDPECKIYRISPLKTAQNGDISFLSTSRYLKDLRNTQASAVILPPQNLTACPTNALLHENPLWSYTKLAELFVKKDELVEPFIHPTALIGKDCQIHPSVSIGAYCVIGNQVTIKEGTIIHSGSIIGSEVTLGKHNILWPRVVLYSDVSIGDHTVIHSGTVIGSDGFGNVQKDGVWVKVPQLGGVTIGDYVEIGANTTIDRGALEHTFIGNGVKIDNQIQIAHNVHIGDNTAIAACTGIAGSAHIGKNCMIGGGVKILGQIKIADKTIIAGASSVGKSIENPSFYMSAFNALPHLKWKKNLIRFNQLDEYVKRLFKLEKEVREK